MLCLLRLTSSNASRTDRQGADLGLRPQRRRLRGSGLFCLLAAPEGLSLDARGPPVIVDPIIPLVLTLRAIDVPICRQASRLLRVLLGTTAICLKQAGHACRPRGRQGRQQCRQAIILQCKRKQTEAGAGCKVQPLLVKYLGKVKRLPLGSAAQILRNPLP